VDDVRINAIYHGIMRKTRAKYACYTNYQSCAKFEVLTAGTMNIIFCHI